MIYVWTRSARLCWHVRDMFGISSGTYLEVLVDKFEDTFDGCVGPVTDIPKSRNISGWVCKQVYKVYAHSYKGYSIRTRKLYKELRNETCNAYEYALLVSSTIMCIDDSWLGDIKPDWHFLHRWFVFRRKGEGGRPGDFHHMCCTYLLAIDM